MKNLKRLGGLLMILLGFLLIAIWGYPMVLGISDLAEVHWLIALLFAGVLLWIGNGLASLVLSGVGAYAALFILHWHWIWVAVVYIPSVALITAVSLMAFTLNFARDLFKEFFK